MLLRLPVLLLRPRRRVSPLRFGPPPPPTLGRLALSFSVRGYVAIARTERKESVGNWERGGGGGGRRLRRLATIEEVEEVGSVLQLLLYRVPLLSPEALWGLRSLLRSTTTYIQKEYRREELLFFAAG